MQSATVQMIDLRVLRASVVQKLFRASRFRRSVRQRSVRRINGGIDDPRLRERFAPFHARAAISAMNRAAFVARPRSRKVDAELRAKSYNLPFIFRDERPEQLHVGVRAESHGIAHRAHELLAA